MNSQMMVPLENGNRKNENSAETRPPLTLDVEVVRCTDINRHASHWNKLRQDNPKLASPYYDLRFIHCVDQVRSDVEIAILKNKSTIVGFFPYQRVSKTTADPVGGMMNDYHGLVGPESLGQYLPEVLRKCGLSAYRFHALQNNFTTDDQKFVYRKLPCPFVDLSQGFGNYHKRVCRHTSTMRRQRQKTRKMEREVGELSLEFDCRDEKVLETLTRWKRAKYQRTRTFDILSVDWTANLLRQVFETRATQFQGLLNVYRAGEHIVAAHMGMLSNGILHYWFPVINQDFARYSPGTQMFLEIANEAADRDVHTIDLGYGDDGFKSKWALDRKFVSYGMIDFNLPRRWASQLADRLWVAGKSFPGREQTKKVLRRLFPEFGKRSYR